MEIVTCSRAVCNATGSSYFCPTFSTFSLSPPFIFLSLHKPAHNRNTANAWSRRSQRYYLAPKAISEEAFL